MAKKVAIDAGHGLYTPGKRCLKSLDKNETREWVLNSRISNYVEQYLKEVGIDTMRVDDTSGRTDVSLSNRVKKANNWKADIYLSVHANAGLNGKRGGGIANYSHTGSDRSANLRNILYKHMIAETGLKGNRSTPCTTANFYVIKYTNMAACLMECGFMDSKDDVPIILTDSFARECALGIAKGTCEYLGIKWDSSSSPNTPVTPPVNKPVDPAEKGYLIKGDTGEAVKTMQRMLNACGFSVGESGIDGSFGNDTREAVMAFQKANGLAVDGSYGSLTKAALTKKYNNLGNSSKPKYDSIKEDGCWGDDTTRLAQQIYKTEVDNDISNQPSVNKKYLERCYEESWKFKSKGFDVGSALIKAIQRDLKDKKYYKGDIDGWCGKNTVIALQKFLNANGFKCGEANGYCGVKTVTAWQKYLNSRR